jgi:hypothetical protein
MGISIRFRRPTNQISDRRAYRAGALSPLTPINSVASSSGIAWLTAIPDLDATALHLEVGKRFDGLLAPAATWRDRPLHPQVS